MRWSNVTSNSTLQPVTICMNIFEDIHCGKILRCWNIQRCDQNRVNARGILFHLESYLEECAQKVWERNRMSLDMHTTWWNVKIRKLMEMILMVFREQSEEDDQMNTVWKPLIFNTRNLARMGTNLERARRILGMTTRQIFTEDTVDRRAQIRANGDWLSWGAHRGDRWSRNKEGCVLLRNLKGFTEHFQKLFMRLSQCETQTKCTVVLQKTSL